MQRERVREIRREKGEGGRAPPTPRAQRDGPRPRAPPRGREESERDRATERPSDLEGEEGMVGSKAREILWGEKANCI